MNLDSQYPLRQRDYSARFARKFQIFFKGLPIRAKPMPIETPSAGLLCNDTRRWNLRQFVFCRLFKDRPKSIDLNFFATSQ